MPSAIPSPSARKLSRLLVVLLLGTTPAISQPIDRKALVERHSPRSESVDPLSPYTVGNGRFAFTADVTGLQSFPEAYANGIPLGIQSEWGWNRFPNPENYRIEDTYELYETGDRDVPYPSLQHTPAGQWLRGNPHRIGLGRIGLRLFDAEGKALGIESLRAIDQRLDLWTGRLISRFEAAGEPVEVVTACHPERDLIAVAVESPLIQDGRLAVLAAFPYSSSDWGIEPGDWESAERHRSELNALEENRLRVHRFLDATRYAFEWTSDQPVTVEEMEPHHFLLTARGSASRLAFTAEFAPSEEALADEPLEPEAAIADSARYWENRWLSGGAIDLSGSSDPRAHELERRVVLSQYLTAAQCRGSLPPQETGLTFNSWYGKPHLEMHWWHGVHFALWDRLPDLETTLPWYLEILPKARELAQAQGYAGVRWPKNVDAAGNQVPSTIAPFLIWQQPHPLYFAELCYRQRPERQTLELYREIVEETAGFMADFVRREGGSERFDLGPPLIPAQESYNPRTTRNPTFELAYWRWGLETAQLWRERLGQERRQDWDRVIEGLAPYPLFEDVYATAAGVWNRIDHPTVLGAYGMLPGEGIDRERMRRTLERVLAEWEWQHTWGWDYPLIAMTAARLGEPELALEALFMDAPKNRYLPNGHNWQEEERLRIYLPGNGALLAAVAMMAAGWDGGPDAPAPGFPQDGSWKVRWENLHRLP